jgi:hypothetical protein
MTGDARVTQVREILDGYHTNASVFALDPPGAAERLAAAVTMCLDAVDGTTARLSAIRRYAAEALADETYDRQVVAERMLGWLDATAHGAPGGAILDAVQLETVRRALADAAEYQTALAEAYCADCGKCEYGRCDEHAAALTWRQEYRTLAADLGGMS